MVYNVLNDHVTLWKPEPIYQLANPRDRFIRNLENPECEINVCQLVSMRVLDMAKYGLRRLPGCGG